MRVIECFFFQWLLPYRALSHDVTAAIVMFQNNETAAMLVFQTNPLGVELFSYVRKNLKLSFKNLHGCWPREWKRSIGRRPLMSSCCKSVHYARMERWDVKRFLSKTSLPDPWLKTIYMDIGLTQETGHGTDTVMLQFNTAWFLVLYLRDVLKCNGSGKLYSHVQHWTPKWQILWWLCLVRYGINKFQWRNQILFGMNPITQIGLNSCVVYTVYIFREPRATQHRKVWSVKGLKFAVFSFRTFDWVRMTNHRDKCLWNLHGWQKGPTTDDIVHYSRICAGGILSGMPLFPSNKTKRKKRNNDSNQESVVHSMQL